MKKIFKNSGFTLIEVLFAVSILLILALASASLAKLSTDANRYADRKNAQSALAQLTIENLRHSSSCDRAMGPASGLSLIVDDTLIRQPSTTGGWPVTLRINNVNSGPTMTDDTIANNTILPLKRLQVDELKFAEAVELETTATDRTYLASLFLRTSDVGGISHRMILVGTLTLKTSLATGAVVSCETTNSASIENTCNQIGCTYNSALTPACRCNRTQVVCAAPGYMPVAFSADGLPDCRPIGGDVQCPAGEFLIGVGIDWHKCGPAPTSVAAGPANGICGSANLSSRFSAPSTSTELCDSGAASSVSGSGSPWSWTCAGTSGGSDASCTANLTVCPTNSSEVGTGDLTSVAGCKCETPTSTWNSSACISGSLPFKIYLLFILLLQNV